MMLEIQDQSTEAAHELASEPWASDLSEVGNSSTLQTDEVDAGATGEMDAGSSLLLEYRAEESAPAEPIGVQLIAEPVPPFSANGFLPDQGDEEGRESKKNHARLATAELIGEPGTPSDLRAFPETAAQIQLSELATVAEEQSKPDAGFQRLTRKRSPLGGSAANPPHTPSSGPKTATACGDGTKRQPIISEPLHRQRPFSEPVPSPTQKNGAKRDRKSDSTQRTDSTLPIRLQLVFGSGGSVKKLVLIPHRHEGMPSSFEVTTVAGSRLQISEATSDSYESLAVSAFGNPLSEGVVLHARSDKQTWRWELTRREIYVLAAGDTFGLSGFVTRPRDQRLWLNTKHVVLAKECLRDQAIGALNEAGCGSPEVCDSTTPGVPAGWILIRHVIPTRTVPMRGDKNILNVLCPGHEIEPDFIGGIKLERGVWLVGFPPRICFAGELANGFKVLIDDQPATRANDGAFESPGWDKQGEYRLWFSDRAQTYALRTMGERWNNWPAHQCSTGAVICGASVQAIDDAHWQQFCIPAANPVLIGARPGEIFRCKIPNGTQSDWVLTTVPFTPVWALPGGRLSKKNTAAVIELVQFKEPLNQIEESSIKLKVTSTLRKWVFAVRNARRNRFRLAVHSEETHALWQRYCNLAKKLRKRLR